jgi:hypothetical protein
MMPGGTPEAYKYIEPIVTKVAAQVRHSCRPKARKSKSIGSLEVNCKLFDAFHCEQGGRTGAAVMQCGSTPEYSQPAC